MTSDGLHALTRAELAVLVPEYLMAGHLVDRAAMPFVIEALGRDGMRDVAIEEWMGASPIYTRRMQRAFGFEGDSVETIFKGMQLDVGAPPQFLDFRYAVHDHDRGEFWLDHCGALADVEPMGEDFVVAMCHDIEDPTFDATAFATNPRAKVRPIHRPPRVPADRLPVCHWTVTIDPDGEPAATPPECDAVAATHAARLDLTPVDPADDGRHRYDGPLLADLRFADWSRSALHRMAEEICLQGHLLALAFRTAIERRIASPADIDTLVLNQLTGAAGVAARRLRRARPNGGGPSAVADLLRLHPALLPAAYVGASIEAAGDAVVVRLPRSSPGVDDRGWPAVLAAGSLAPLDAIAAAVDPRFGFVEHETSDASWLVAELVVHDEPQAVAESVAIAGLSTGVDFAFADRGVPVAVRSTVR